MTFDRVSREHLPEVVERILDEFKRSFTLDLHLWKSRDGQAPLHLYPREGRYDTPRPGSILLAVQPRGGAEMLLEIRGESSPTARSASNALRTTLEHLYDYAEEVRLFAFEISDRYEEINLLYSISETLGSLLQLNEASATILSEVCDVLGAGRGSLWVLDPAHDRLDLVASVGAEGLTGPIPLDDPRAVTSRVAREGRPIILAGNRLRATEGGSRDPLSRDDSVLSVPIRYTPPGGDTRTVGVINLIGRKKGGLFTASDLKLLSAVASQIGAALENNRLIRESLEQERVTREMQLAHDLQIKLLPTAEGFDPERIAARVTPADSVGGDFYHFFRIPGDRIGVMIGDVSGHGFPAALIMALSMSAATIYATEVQTPARVLQGMGEALMDELETTEMYLTLFYGVVDPERGELVYANAGHPHAFAIRSDGSYERLQAMDPPMGIAGAMEYQQRAVPWEAGKDLLLLFTDGLSDDLVAETRTAGEELLLRTAVEHRDRPVCEIVAALFNMERRELNAGLRVGDDRTAVVLRA